MMHQLVINVRGERHVPGQKVDKLVFEDTIDAEVESKQSMFLTLMKEFGRCYGKVPMGYKFGTVERYDDGTKGFLYTIVTVLDGATPAPGFSLG